MQENVELVVGNHHHPAIGGNDATPSPLCALLRETSQRKLGKIGEEKEGSGEWGVQEIA